MSTNLYVVRHRIDSEAYNSPCVGDDELRIHMEMAETFGAQLVAIKDVELELRRWLFDCYFEGALKEWDRDIA